MKEGKWLPTHRNKTGKRATQQRRLRYPSPSKLAETGTYNRPGFIYKDEGLERPKRSVCHVNGHALVFPGKGPNTIIR